MTARTSTKETSKAQRVNLSDPRQLADRPTLTVADLAAMLETSEAYIRAEIRAGHLEAWEIAGGWRTTSTAVAAWLASKRIAPKRTIAL